MLVLPESDRKLIYPLNSAEKQEKINYPWLFSVIISSLNQ